jgi:hypothetical protein
MSMGTTTEILTLEDGHSAVSWKAVLAGTVAAAAVTLLMVAFGVGVGFSVVSPWAGQGISSTTFTIAAGIYLIVVAMIPSTIGGYIAGRLRSQWQTVHAHERYFRDSAHGFLVWALTTVVIAAFLGGAMTHIISGLGGGVTAASGVAASSAATDVYVDRLVRNEPTQGERAAATPASAVAPSSATPNGPAAVAPQADAQAPQTGARARVNRAEISRVLAPAMLNGGNVAEADKAYLVQVVAARNGIPQAQAEQRVNQVITDAKSAADTARKSAAKFSLWLVISMLAGALAASLAAIEGGSLRNREWYLTAR